MTCDRVRECPDHRPERGEDRGEASLQPAWRADADQLPHEETEIEAAGVDQHSLPNVRVSAEIQPAHPAGLIEMREGPFEALAAEPQQAEASRTVDPPTITVHRVAGRGVLLPVPSAAIGLGDVTADAHGFEVDERLVAVIALVA